jgi:hypothetical protein
MGAATKKSTSRVNSDVDQKQADAFTAEALCKLPPDALSQAKLRDTRRHLPVELVEEFLHCLVIA